MSKCNGELDIATNGVDMEEVPAVLSMSVIDNGETMGLNAQEFTIAVDGDNGYYIIQLPSEAINGQLITEEVLLTHAALLIENKHNPLEGLQEEQGQNENELEPTSEGVVVSPVCDNSDNVIYVTASGSAAIATESSPSVETISEPLQPVQVQYLQEGVGDVGVIVLDEEQKCAVANLLEFHNQNQQATSNSDKPEDEEVCDASLSYDENAGADETVTVKEEKVLPDSVVALNGLLTEVERVEIKVEPGVAPGLFTTSSDDHDQSQPELAEEVDIKVNLSSKKPMRTYGKSLKISKQVVDTSSAESEPLSAQSLLSDGEKEIQKTIKVENVTVSQPARITLPICGKKRRRRLIIDSVKQIPAADFKNQLKNTKDIVQTSGHIAPATKETMKCLENGGVPKFFSSPGRPIRNLPLSRLYTNHLVIMAEPFTGSPSRDIVPLSSDLRIASIPSPSTSQCKDNNSEENGLSANLSVKKQVNIGKPGGCSVESMFKGLSKPPVFKEYTRAKRKTNPPSYSSPKLLKVKQQSSNQCSANEPFPELKIQAVSGGYCNKDTEDANEVVYSVDGESIVLKSSDNGGDDDSQLVITGLYGNGDPPVDSQQQQDNSIESLTPKNEVTLGDAATSIRPDQTDKSFTNEASTSDIDMSKTKDEQLAFAAAANEAALEPPMDQIIGTKDNPYNLQTVDDLKLWSEVSPS